MPTMPNTISTSRSPRRMLVAGLGAALLLSACSEFDLRNTNAPTVEELTGTPSRAVLARTATGIFSQALNDVGGIIQQWGIYGREGYNLLGNDPRETGEEIRGPQEAGGRGGGVWAGGYGAIRTINAYLAALPVGVGVTEQEVRASAGFAKTIKAWHMHRIAVRTGALGMPIDVDKPITEPPAPFVSFAAAEEAVSALLDEVLSKAQNLGIDPNRLGLWMASGGTPAGLSLLLRNAYPFVHCAAAFYGRMNLAPVRAKIPASVSDEMLRAYSPVYHLRQVANPQAIPPLLIARAGRDGLHGVNESIDEFVAEALAHNLNLELHNHPDGEHGFDIFNDDDLSRAIVRRTLAFFREHLEGL